MKSRSPFHILLTLALVALPLTLLAATPAQGPLPPETASTLPVLPFPTDLGAFIVWLAGNSAAAILIPLVIERWAWFRNWRSEWKGRVVFIAYLAFPAFGQLALWAWNTVDVGLRGIVVSVLGLGFVGLAQWWLGQRAHQADIADAPLAFGSLPNAKRAR